MTLDIKICGLKTDEAVNAALAAGATHIGFIFFPKSPRNVTAGQAAALRKAAAGKAQAVAVTVDADDESLARIVDTVRPDMLQLHGGESPDRVSDIRTRFGLPVMKALSVRESADLGRVAAYRGVVERLLFDAKPPAGSQLPGGNGVSFDWRLLAGLDGDLDYMLSGGLNAANVGDALRLTRPTGIDVSSGVESAPGVKDAALIRDFFRAVRAFQQARV